MLVKKKKSVEKSATKAKNASTSGKPSSNANCSKFAPCDAGFFDDDKFYKGSDGEIYSGKELNEAAKAIYAESSPSGSVNPKTKEPYSPDERRREKEAMMGALSTRRQAKQGYPGKRKGKQDSFSDVIRSKDQFEAITGHGGLGNSRWQSVKDTNSPTGVNCEDLKESVEAVKQFLKGGSSSTFDSWVALNQGKGSLEYVRDNEEIIAGTRFRYGEMGKKIGYDEYLKRRAEENK